jgi:cyclopropane fatty-acyl-phospholipid synthase-like methyltransferase
MTDTTRFDQEAANWDADAGRHQLAAAVADAIIRQVPLTPEMDALDFGCGTGLVTLALAAHVRSVTGADTSSGMLGVLEGKVRERGLTSVKTRLLRPDEGYALAGEFDLIASSMTLHHVHETARLLARFRQHLRAGGWLALADLDREDGTFHDPGTTDVFHQGFDRASLRGMLEALGFERLADTTAFVRRRNGRDYPVFLISGRVAT